MSDKFDEIISGKGNFKINTLISLLSVFVLYFIYWLSLPTLSLFYLSGAVFWLFATAILVGNLYFWIGYKFEDLFSIILKLFIGLVILLFLAMFASWNFLHVGFLKQQIGTPIVREFSSDIKHIDTVQIPIVDPDFAQKLGDKKLGEDSVLGSQVVVGQFTRQNVNGELILVAPLLHSGFFKWWLGNTDGTPGYIRISASNPQDVRLVRQINGKDIKIKYQPTAYFSDDLKRHVRSSGIRFDGITDYSFELDDSGNPFWVITTYDNETVFGNPEATGVVTVDAQTGDVRKYSAQINSDIIDVPAWVDRIQPVDFIERQINLQGAYVEGRFNFSDRGKFKTTEGVNIVYNNGRCYYYTGLTSYGSDDATIGFYLVDTRTKELILYKINGAHENAAMRSADGLVQDFGYTSTLPIPLNIEGIPTYFLTLKDNEGLIKSYAFVNIYNYSIAEVSDNINLARRNYLSKVNSNANNIVIGDKSNYKTLTGIVNRISGKVEGGNTVYIFALKDSKHLYMATSHIADELTITQPSDNVTITYVDTGSAVVTVQEFDNLMFDSYVSPAQEEKNKLVEQGEKQSTEKLQK